VKIDKSVEPSVREAFAASVAEEPERFDTALEAIADRGETFTRDAVNLAIAVDAAALILLHEGDAPDEDQAEELAHDFVESQSWAGISEDVAATFLAGVSTDATPLPDLLPVGDIAQASFAIGGWLLAAFLPEDKDWTDFLDEILGQLEAAPEPH
jgi:hypothetical protein